jgi:phosphatidylglycerol---prolipoprotein diacylglyceryl transferase
MNVVQFPGLWGLEITVYREAFRIFSLPIYCYGILQAAAFMTAIILGMRHSKKFGLEPDNIIDLVLFVIPAAIIGARIFYVIFNWEDFSGNLLEVFNTRNGGLAIYGALITSFTTAYIFARVKKINVVKLFDFGIVYLPIAQAIGRWGNFFNQEAFGTNTELPWGMISGGTKSYLTANFLQLQQIGINVDPNLPVHPTFLYECLWNIAAFIFLLWFRKRSKRHGDVFFVFLMLYGLIRFMNDGIRTDALMAGSLNASRITAGIILACGLIPFILRRIISKKNEEEEEVEIGTSEYGAVLRKMNEEEEEEE